MAREPGSSPRSRRSWPRIFLFGAGLWVACLLTIAVTGNAALVPTLIQLPRAE
jgi:hypothetical protein